MDDLERTLTAGLTAEVGEWTPTPSEVRRTASAQPRPRLQVALALAIVLCVSAGGIGVAVGLGGSGHRAGQVSLAEVPSAPEPSEPPPTGDSGSTASCAVAPPVDKPCDDVVTAVPSLAATLPSPAGSSAVLGGPAQVGPSMLPSGVPTVVKSIRPKPSVYKLPAQCTSADLHLSLTTDASSYVQTTPVAITVSSTSTATCDAEEPEVAIQPVAEGGGLGDGHFAWVTCHGRPPLLGALATVCTTSLGIVTRQPGETKGASYSWNMVDLMTQARQPLSYVNIGNYLITYSWGSVKITKTITVTEPPACTADQLTDTISADATSYAQGQAATFTGVVRNTSQQLCGAAPYVRAPTITDSSGTVVWSCGVPAGVPRGQACVTNAMALGPEPLVPGATMTLRTSTWTWNLVHDGTTDTDPGPVPDGTYTLGWAGVGIGTATPVTLTVTG